MATQNAAAEFQLAAALDATGQTAAASAAYLAILMGTPDHEGTLNNYGALLMRTGHRSAARTLFAQAAACHPDHAAGHVNLAHLLRGEGSVVAAQHHYHLALAHCPDCKEAHQGLGYLLTDAGDTVRAAEHRRRGWQDRVFTPWRYRGTGRPLRVLLPMSTLGGNVPAQAFLDDATFAVTAVAMEFFDPAIPLPPHDAVLNAVGDADACGDALDALAGFTSRGPVLNAADAVRATGRTANAIRLGRGPGVRTAGMATFARAALDGPALVTAGIGFPLLLRVPGFHTGQHFVRVAEPKELAAAVADLPGTDLLAMEALPTTGPCGLSRKYRVMVIGGALYPLHLAISRAWKVHYFTAAMAEDAAFRAEEKGFLDDMAAVLGPRAMAALAWVARTLGLDYAGIDFALAEDGTVLLFEANAAMALVAPPPGAQWDYRRAAFDAALRAARALVVSATTGRAVSACTVVGALMVMACPS